MKNVFFILSFATLLSCKKEESVVAFKKATVDLVSVYATSTNTAEASISIGNVSQEVPEVGIVWAEKSNPTISENRATASGIKENQNVLLPLNGLKSGQTYYVRSYINQGGETTYSTEMQLIQNFSGNWVRVSSPDLEVDEYIDADNVSFVGGIGGFAFNKVNKTSNMAVTQYYFPNFREWNPRFFNLPTTPALMRYNQIQSPFITRNETLVLVGAGYQKLPNGQRFYLKDLSIQGASGYKWEPSYPGANAPVSSFGLGKFAYVLENLPNGKLWRFDFNTLSWKDLGEVPYTKTAKFVCFANDKQIFMLVEPENWSENLIFYEYLPESNTWERRTAFAGINRRRGVAFMVNNRLFYGVGQQVDNLRPLRDIWEYEPIKNTWKKITDYPGGGTINLAWGTLGNNLYIGFGHQVSISSVHGEGFKNMIDFWRFNP